MNKLYAISVHIYTKDNNTFANIKTNDDKEHIITWTNKEERDKFIYNGYTIFNDERGILTNHIQDKKLYIVQDVPRDGISNYYFVVKAINTDMAIAIVKKELAGKYDCKSFVAILADNNNDIILE